MILIVESVVVNFGDKLISVILRRADGRVYEGVLHIVESRGIVGLQGLEKILEDMDEEIFGVLLPKLIFKILRGEVINFPHELKC